MKIALVHMRHADIGGTELFLNQFSKYLCEQGEEVTIICRTHSVPSHPNIKFRVLKPFSIGKTHRVYSFAKAVEKHIKDCDYDIVYALGKTWSHDLIRVGGGTRKNIVRLRKNKKPTLRDRISIYIERKAFSENKNYLIISNSEKTKSELIEDYSVKEDSIVVIHNAVDTNRFDKIRVKKAYSNEIKALNLDLTKKIYLFLGSGYNRKGLNKLLESYSLIDDDSCLLIVGNETHPELYKEKAKELGIYDKCRFLGKSDKPELFFSIANCYILPTKYEPFGYTVIEALSCGCPVITTDQCGAKEVISASCSSVLPLEFKVEQLAEDMIYWSDKSLQHGFSDICRNSVISQDTTNIMKENYDAVKLVYKEKIRNFN